MNRRIAITNLAISIVFFIISLSAVKKLESAELIDNEKKLYLKTSEWIGEELTSERHKIMNRFYEIEAGTARGLRSAMIRAIKILSASYLIFIVLNGFFTFTLRK